jgi:hypothetical protein
MIEVFSLYAKRTIVEKVKTHITFVEYTTNVKISTTDTLCITQVLKHSHR